jgi:hypothetical protein
LALGAAWLWLGMLLTLGFLAAPSAFAVLPREQAGHVVARLFQQEAYAGLSIGALLLIGLWRWAGKSLAARATVELALAIGASLCTVVGYFALQPVLASARAGQTAWPFAAWHGVSMVFFAVKIGLVGILGWRLSGFQS